MNKDQKCCVPSVFDTGFFPSLLRQISLFDDESAIPTLRPQNSNVELSEDEKHVYIEAHLPGVPEKDIEVTQDKGILWIRGEAKEQEKDSKKKYYHRAARSFSYRIAIPGNIDEAKTPTATYHNGVLQISYPKMPIEGPKKIEITSKS
jgi:HSP20 family protein